MKYQIFEFISNFNKIFSYQLRGNTSSRLSSKSEANAGKWRRNVSSSST